MDDAVISVGDTPARPRCINGKIFDRTLTSGTGSS